MAPVLVALALVAYNNLMNLWAPFRGGLYVALNLGVTAGLVALALGSLDLSAEAIGFRGTGLRGAAAGAALGLALTAPLFAAAIHPRARALVADERVRELSGGEVAYRTLVRIPFGTALLEEVAFRGVLFAAWRPMGVVQAGVASSVAFGLWHVTPTLDLVQTNRPEAGAAARAGAVVASVALTTVGGMLLTWLRVRSGGLAAPLALHATLNSLATVAAFLAHRLAGAGA